MKIKSIALFAYISLAQMQYAIASCDSLEKLDWMLGRWTAESGSGKLTEEWLQVSDMTIEGAGFATPTDGQIKMTETMRIAFMRENAFYIVDVGHNARPVVYEATTCTEAEVRFENPQHDFPNILHYKRSNDGYTVNVFGSEGKGFTLTFSE